MDDLINILQNFDITSFDDNLDNLIGKITITDYDEEWNTLTENYSKLKHISRLINYHKISTLKFGECLNLFLNDLDKINQYYLKELNWDDNEDVFFDKTSEVKNLLETSLNMFDPYKKLEIIIKAYFIFLPIVEFFRNEKFVENITDQRFLQTFKKRKFE